MAHVAWTCADNAVFMCIYSSVTAVKNQPLHPTFSVWFALRTSLYKDIHSLLLEWVLSEDLIDTKTLLRLQEGAVFM